MRPVSSSSAGESDSPDRHAELAGSPADCRQRRIPARQPSELDRSTEPGDFDAAHRRWPAPQAGPDVIQIGWHDIAGESLGEQAKTVLAGIGVLGPGAAGPEVAEPGGTCREVMAPLLVQTCE